MKEQNKNDDLDEYINLIGDLFSTDAYYDDDGFTEEKIVLAVAIIFLVVVVIATFLTW